MQILIATFAAAVALSGCAVGPDFRPPDAPTAGSYTARALPERTADAPGWGGASQRFVRGKEIPGEWWSVFRCEALDRVIRQAIAESPSLDLARARVLEAREIRRARYGALLPGVDANVSASRQKVSGAQFGQNDAAGGTFTLISASVSVSYALDLFGATRRDLEALQSEVDFEQFQLEGVHLTLTSTIAVAAVKEASLRAQIRATREIVALQEEQLAVVERRQELGGVSLSDVLAQRAQLAQTRATLPPLERDLDQTRHRLAVLSGKLPSEAVLPEFDLEGFHLPGELPVSLPSSLVRQRPDIRAAEALLHAASARVGVATAQFYPQITLTGGFGSTAAAAGGLFDASSTVWNIGAGLLQPLFHGGTLSARRRAAEALYDQASAQYRETVLGSFQTVADVLRALEADARTLKAQAEVEAAAGAALDLTRRQFEFGAAAYLALLNAQRQHQEALLGSVRARAARFADTAALYQALGGGWWNRGAPDAAVARISGE